VEPFFEKLHFAFHLSDDSVLFLCSLEGLRNERNNGHRTDTAGNRRVGAAAWGSPLEINIPYSSWVISRIDDNRSFFYPIRPDEFGLSHCSHDNVCLPNDIGQIDRPGMANGHGRMAVEKHHGQGLPENRTPADYNSTLALDCDVVVI
jgi:hypothetical protein